MSTNNSPNNSRRNAMQISNATFVNVLNKIERDILNHNEDAVLALIARTRHLMRSGEAAIGDGSVALGGRPRDSDELPPLRNPPKKLKSKDVWCPTCNAKVGRPCHRMSARGVGAVPTPEILEGKVHPARTARAKKASGQ